MLLLSLSTDQLVKYYLFNLTTMSSDWTVGKVIGTKPRYGQLFAVMDDTGYGACVEAMP